MLMMDILKGKVTLKDWLFVGAVLVVTVGLFVTFYYMVYTKTQIAIEDQREELQQIGRRLEDARTIDANIGVLRAEAEEMKILVQLFEARLPERREIPSLLSRFESQAGELGLRVQLVPTPTLMVDNLETIPYKVTASGKFHDIVTFINLLERAERYFKISAIDIGEEKDGVSKATFELHTFRFTQRATGNI